MRYLLAIWLLLTVPTALVAQAVSPTPDLPSATPSSGNDIVVQGTPDGPFAVGVDARDYVDIGTAGL